MSLYKKPGKTNKQVFHRVQKSLFLGTFGPKLVQKNFFYENFFVHNLNTLIPCLCTKKSGKTNEQIFHKVQKTLFFSKIGLRHILGITILHLCTENQKIPMSQS